MQIVTKREEGWLYFYQIYIYFKSKNATRQKNYIRKPIHQEDISTIIICKLDIQSSKIYEANIDKTKGRNR